MAEKHNDNPEVVANAQPVQAQPAQSQTVEASGQRSTDVVQPTTSVDEVSADSVDAAAKQREEDEAWLREHPNEPLVRAANTEVGGESF